MSLLTSSVTVSSLSNLKVHGEIHRNQITEAFEELKYFPNDMVIVSKENEEIVTNKYLLTLFSPSLSSFFNTECCISQKIFLPDSSTKSIKHLLSVINTGVAYNDNFDEVALSAIIDTAKLLSIDIKA